MPRSRALSEVVASETNNMSQSQRSQSQRGLSQSQSQREDERQSASEHSKLRKRLESNKGALVNPRSNELQTEIRQANELMESVPAHSTRELNRNFSVFSRMAELAVEQAQLGERNTSKFTLDTLGVKLASAYTRNHEKLDEIEDEEDRMEHMREHFDWEALGRRNNIFLAAPTVEFMTAPMGLKVKERKTIKRQKRGVVGPKVKPTELKDTEQVNEEHTELMVEIKKSVHGHGKFQLFWPFVLQGDLGSTILRIFACCFLAREVSAPNACCLLARLAGCRAPLTPLPSPPPSSDTNCFSCSSHLTGTSWCMRVSRASRPQGWVAVQLNTPGPSGRLPCPHKDAGELLIGPHDKEASGDTAAGGGTTVAATARRSTVVMKTRVLRPVRPPLSLSVLAEDQQDR
jgi:hypothetical protein